MLNRIYPKFKYLLGWPLALISLVFVFSLLARNSDALFSITKINLGIFALGIVTFIVYFFTRVALWKEILGKEGKNISFKEMSYLWGISEFKRYTPGNIWSFISRHELQKEKGIKKKRTIKSLILEAELVVTSTFILSISSLSYYFNPTLVLLLLIVFSFGLFTYIAFSLFKNRKFNTLLFGELTMREKVKLIVLSLFNFFLFALGSYLVSASIVNLNLKNITEFIGIFSFSLLAGYLSFITPMGLGVREGAVVVGFSKFIPVSYAALISVFSRVSFVLSELIFLGIVVAWNRTKSKNLAKVESYVSKHKYELALISCILIYVIYFTTASFLRHDNFFTGRFDLGNMDQVVWNTSQGRIFQMTNSDGTNIVSRLAFHADFILILLAPFYWIFSSPKTLLLIQSIVLGGGAFFIYLLSLNILKKKNISLVFAVSYLLYPALGYTNLYDFHPVTLATTFLLASFYFLIKKRYLLFISLLMLAAFTKEQLWIVSFLLSLFMVIKVIRERVNLPLITLGILTAVVSLGMFFFLINKAIPGAHGGEHFALEYYSEFGGSPGEVIKSTLFNPTKTIQTVFQEDQLGYLRQLFVPLGLLSLIAPEYLIFAAPDLGISLLSNNEQLYQIYYQYSAVITPFVFIAAIYAVGRLKRRSPKISLFWISIFITISTIYSAYVTGPLPLSKRPNIDMFIKPNVLSLEFRKVLSQIPKDASVTATNNLGAHLSHRERIHTIPIGMADSDYIAFLHGDSFAKPSPSEQLIMSEGLKRNPMYEVVYEKDNMIIFKRKYLVKSLD